MLPLVLIVFVLIGLFVFTTTVVLFRRKVDHAMVQSGLDAILFWGVISSVLGVLGQITGIYNALNAIIGATEINPRIIYMGFAESFTTTLYGLWTLLLSAIIWFVLFMRYRRITAAKA